MVVRFNCVRALRQVFEFYDCSNVNSSSCAHTTEKATSHVACTTAKLAARSRSLFGLGYRGTTSGVPPIAPPQYSHVTTT